MPEGASSCGVVIPSSGVGCGVGVCVGAGLGVGGGAVTNVTAGCRTIVWPDRVFALGLTMTWYWVFGASPFWGTISTVLSSTHR